jgi:hypothetical protein
LASGSYASRALAARDRRSRPALRMVEHFGAAGQSGDRGAKASPTPGPVPAGLSAEGQIG